LCPLSEDNKYDDITDDGWDGWIPEWDEDDPLEEAMHLVTDVFGEVEEVPYF
jgi:hypothetical protein